MNLLCLCPCFGWLACSLWDFPVSDTGLGPPQGDELEQVCACVLALDDLPAVFGIFWLVAA